MLFLGIFWSIKPKSILILCHIDTYLLYDFPKF